MAKNDERVPPTKDILDKLKLYDELLLEYGRRGSGLSGSNISINGTTMINPNDDWTASSVFVVVDGGSGNPRTNTTTTVATVDEEEEESQKEEKEVGHHSSSYHRHHHHQQLCHLASILPISDGAVLQFDNGLNANAAALMAVLHFNSRNGVIVPDLNDLDDDDDGCNIRLSLDMLDSKLNPLVASRELVDYSTHHKRVPCAVLGAVKSSVTTPISVLSTTIRRPLISFQSTSPSLNNKVQHEYFSRTINDDTAGAIAAMSYLRTVLGVTHVSILSVRDDFGIHYLDALQRAGDALDPPMIMVSSYFDWKCGGTIGFCPPSHSSLQSALLQLNGTTFNYFMVVTHSSIIFDLVVHAQELGMMGNDQFWLLSDDGGRRLHEQSNNLDGPPSWFMENPDWIRAANGLSYISRVVPPNPVLDEEYRRLVDEGEFGDYFLSKLPFDFPSEFDYYRKLSDRDYLAYDAVMALGIGACRALASSPRRVERNVNSTSFSNGKSGEIRTSSDDIDFDSSSSTLFLNGTGHIRGIRNSMFTGASGEVEFDPITGTRFASDLVYEVINVVADGTDETGKFHPHRVAIQHVGDDCHHMKNREQSQTYPPAPCPLNWIVTSELVFSDNTTTPPPLSSTVEEMTLVSEPLLIVGFGIGVVFIVLTMGFMVWTVTNRQSKRVRVSQPVFLLMLCFGSLMVASSTLPRFVQELTEEPSVACMAKEWAFHIGGVIGLSALYSKVRRIRKIYDHGLMCQRITVKYMDVLVPFIVLFLMTVAVLTTWTVLAPLEWTRVVTSEDEYGFAMQSTYNCLPARSWEYPDFIFRLTLSGIGFLAIGLAILQLYKAREVALLHEEGPHIMVALLSLIQIVTVSAPVFFVRAGHVAAFIVEAVFPALYCAAFVLPIFIPLISNVKREKRRSTIFVALKHERQLRAMLVQKNLELKSECDHLGVHLSSDAESHDGSQHGGERVAQSTRCIQGAAAVEPLRSPS